MLSSVEKLLVNQRTLIIGHRGACAGAPENTLPSFQLALKAGADLIEFDYHTSQDGVPIVIHDSTLDRTTNARSIWRARNIRVANKTVAEIKSLDAGRWFDRKFAGTRVPLFTEAIDFIRQGGSVPLIEHKAGDADTCVRILRAHSLINEVVIISFDWSFLHAFHKLEPAQVLGALGRPTHLVEGNKPTRRSKQLDAGWLDALDETGAELVVWNRQVSETAVQLAHDRGLEVWVYTVNEIPDAQKLAQIGVDGIITNYPGRIREALTELS